MVFKGHKFKKLINDNWVLDFTEFKGYKVKSKNGQVLDYKLAFNIEIDDNNRQINFNKKIPVPVKVMREAREVVEQYLKTISRW